MTEAVAHPDASMDAAPEQAGPAPRAALATLGAAAAAALIVPGSRAGLGLALASAAILVAAATGSDVRRSRWRLGLLIAAVLLALTPVLRDAHWLVSLDLLLAVALAAVALAGAGTWGSQLQAAAEFVLHLATGPAAVVRVVLARFPTMDPGAFAALARGSLLAAAMVTVFAALFASADEAFAHLFGNLSPDFGELDPLARIAIATAAIAIGGALALFAAGLDREAPPLSEEIRRPLAPLEWGISLGAVTLLFAAFVGVQFVVLFGGQDHVLETADLTYAEYAREGFVQLVVAAALVLGVVAGALRWARTSGERGRLVLHALLTALCVLTLVILVSAGHRLDLYVDAFGATRMRLIAAVTCVWIGAVLIAVTVALWRRDRGWLPPTITALTAAVALSVTIANPDARIAERNVDRYRGTAAIDQDYNAGLSADATPALALLPASVADSVLADQSDRLASPDGFWGVNIAREDARDALAASR